MQTFRFSVSLLLVFIAWVGTSNATSIPAFTPNVVDPAHVLTQKEVEQINAVLERIRDNADIWGAVFIVENLEESIESLAEKAFRTWELGEKGKDNGLLLVLSLKDRKARLEVGYGLEGELTDAVTKRVQEQVLVPFMRQGETIKAITETFSRLASMRKDGALAPTQKNGEVEEGRDGEGKSFFGNNQRGLQGLSFYLLCLWLVGPITALCVRQRSRRLEENFEEYKVAHDSALSKKSSLRSILFRNLFLTINPGFFIFVGSAMNPIAFWVLIAACALISVLFCWFKTQRYRSKEAYLSFLEKLRKKNESYIQKGYIKETILGKFEYTGEYFKSEEYKATRARSKSSTSRHSSYSSSTHRSSSGGGRSGGGGSNSSW